MNAVAEHEQACRRIDPAGQILEVRRLVLPLAAENRMGLSAHSWRTGRTGLPGLVQLGVEDLAHRGVDPAPRRGGPTWTQFLTNQPQQREHVRDAQVRQS
jgi:hypothetical protein